MLSTPVDFYVGAVELFTVLLPGALMSFLGLDFAQKYIFGPVLPAPKGDIANAVVFIVASYVMGYFVFALGGYLDPIYDNTYRKWKREKWDKLYNRTCKIVETSLEDHKDITDTVGELKWASAFVRLRNASAAREIDRLEAVSKFFRGFVLVLAVGCIIFLIRGLWLPFVICGLLAVLSFALFSTRRWKQAELTCLYFIQLSTTPVRIGEAVGVLPHGE